jgi:hypothetical protein
MTLIKNYFKKFHKIMKAGRIQKVIKKHIVA